MPGNTRRRTVANESGSRCQSVWLAEQQLSEQAVCIRLYGCGYSFHIMHTIECDMIFKLLKLYSSKD